MSTNQKTYPTAESLETFIFEGIDGEECEDLIHAVRLHARKAQRMKDDEHMARWAAACMVGGALRWYVALPKEIKYDWEELERALMAEYPINIETRSRSLKHRPGDIRRGRIRMICDTDPTREGYISRVQDTEKFAVPLTSKFEALQVEWVTPTDGGVSRLRLLNQLPIEGKKYDLLGAYFWTDVPLDQGTAACGFMTPAVAFRGGTLEYAHGTRGDPKVDIWRISQDGFISIHWDKDGQSHDLIATIHSTGTFKTHVLCPSDLPAFNTKYGSTDHSLATRLFLEPLD